MISSGASKKAASKSATSPEFVELTEDVAATTAGVVAGAGAGAGEGAGAGAGADKAKEKAKAKTSVESESASEASNSASKKAASKSATSPEFVELTEDVAATRKSVGEKSRYLPSISVESTPANSDSGYVHPVPTSTTSSSKGFTDKIDDITPDSKRFLRGV